MKNFIVSALLTGMFALQGASAEIRTFEATASIDTLSLEYIETASIAGIDAGTILNTGDSVIGKFSFNDEGRDFVDANTTFSSEDVKFISFALPKSNTAMEFDYLLTWSHNPNIAASSTFMLGGVNEERLVAGGVTVYSPRYGFEWELDDDTVGFFHVRWIWFRVGTGR